MRRSAIAFAIAAVSLAFFASTAPPAAAIDTVACRDGAGFTELHNEKRHCFANAGLKAVYITDVYLIKSGNNNVGIRYNKNDGSAAHVTLAKFEEMPFSPRITVTEIFIL